MYPELSSIGGFALKTYALICALAMFAAMLPVRSEARRLGWNVEAASWLVVSSTLVGWIGAHVLYAFTRFDLDWAEWWKLLVSFGSGNVWYGGFLAAWWFVDNYARRHDIEPLKMYDVAAFAVIVAQAVGRLGCVFGGCCYGLPTSLPWGIVLSNRDYAETALHPTPLYETLFLSAVFLWLWRIRTQRARPGHIAALYLIVTATGRFALEFLRGDRVRGFVWGWLSTSQLIALVLLAVGVGLYVRVTTRRNPLTDESASPAELRAR